MNSVTRVVGSATTPSATYDRACERDGWWQVTALTGKSRADRLAQLRRAVCTGRSTFTHNCLVAIVTIRSKESCLELRQIKDFVEYAVDSRIRVPIEFGLMHHSRQKLLDRS